MITTFHFPIQPLFNHLFIPTGETGEKLNTAPLDHTSMKLMSRWKKIKEEVTTLPLMQSGSVAEEGRPQYGKYLPHLGLGEIGEGFVTARLVS